MQWNALPLSSAGLPLRLYKRCFTPTHEKRMRTTSCLQFCPVHPFTFYILITHLNLIELLAASRSASLSPTKTQSSILHQGNTQETRKWTKGWTGTTRWRGEHGSSLRFLTRPSDTDCVICGVIKKPTRTSGDIIQGIALQRPATDSLSLYLSLRCWTGWRRCDTAPADKSPRPLLLGNWMLNFETQTILSFKH